VQTDRCSPEHILLKSKTHRRCYTLSFLLFTLILLIAYSLPLNATIRFVSKSGSSEPPFLTWETSADSIQECINISVFGDTIYVANGVYQEQVVMIAGLALIGAGMDSCILDARQLVTMQNYKSIDMKDSCLIKGFYIISTNNFDYGYGIYTNQQTGIITENKFSNANTGIILRYSDAFVYKNYFFNVRTGLRITNSNPIIRNNLITMNVQGVYGIEVEGFTNDYSPVIDSNYIYNVYGYGIHKFFGARPVIKNI
jgi:hypothetical protein